MEEYTNLILGLISILIAIIFFFLGRRKRYTKTLYCDNSRDYMVVTTGIFSDKMVVYHDGKVVTGNMWCIYRTFVNVEQTDIMCGKEVVSIKAPNGKWVDAKIGSMTEGLNEREREEKGISVVVSGDDRSILHLKFENLRENEGFVLQGLLETTESEVTPLKIYHRIPDLNKVKVCGEVSSLLRQVALFLTLLITVGIVLSFVFVSTTVGDMPEWLYILVSFISIMVISLLNRAMVKKSRPRKVERIVKNLLS